MEIRDSKAFEKTGKGFTLIELIVVIVILSVAAVLAVPMLSSAADVQVRSAAARLAADLDYARGMAVTHQRPFQVVCVPGSESYSLRDASGVIAHPLDPGTFEVNFAADSRLSRVDMVSANFDGAVDNTVTFDYLGAPYSGAGTGTALNSGRITLRSNQFTLYVDIEPVTGYVTITQP